MRSEEMENTLIEIIKMLKQKDTEKDNKIRYIKENIELKEKYNYSTFEDEKEVEKLKREAFEVSEIMQELDSIFREEISNYNKDNELYQEMNNLGDE